MAVLLTPPYLQFFDDDANPLSGGKIYTYAAGTLTPKATYTDASETTPLSNPVILDSAGRATIWISGSYYIDVRTSADVAVKNTDNITAFNTSSSSINSLLPSQSGNAGKALVTDGNNVSWVADSTILRNYIDGFQMSTAGSSTTMTIGDGKATNSVNTAYISLSSLSKTTSAWAVGTGNGGLDTGSIANTTWYHFYTILRPDTGITDVLFSTNASSPTLPANYTQFRRIGSGLTNGSAQWVKFIQVGNRFEWDVPTLDVSATAPGTAAVTRTLNVPTGLSVLAILNVQMGGQAATANAVYISALDVADAAASRSAAPLASLSSNANANSAFGGIVTCRTNTSSQIRSRMENSDGTTVLRISSIGWIDNRGAF